MFVSSDLAAQIEAADTSFLAEILAGVQRRRPDVDAWCEPFAGGCAGYAGPDVPVNKIVGLGFAGVPSAERLEEIESRYHERKASVVAEIATHADPAIFQALGERGYRLTAFEDVVGIALPAAEGPRADGVVLTTAPAGCEREPWLDVLVEGFATPDGQGVDSHEEFPRDFLREIMRDLASVPNFTAYLASLDGEVVGGGSLRAHGDIAHFCGAATLPAARGRGVQTTLCSERLQAAYQAGCKLAVTVTQPGSKSQQNMKRQGFELLFSRAVMVLPAG